MTIGEALTAAKQQYAAGNAILSPYDLKALMESTFYGLPMYHLNTSPVPTNGTSTLFQAAPTSGMTNTGTAFADQLSVTGTSSSVTFTQATGSPDISVSLGGAVSASASLPVGTYTATGTDTDASGDTGMWTYTLSVTPQTQTDPTTGLEIAPVTLSLPILPGSGDLGLGQSSNGQYYQVNGAPGGGTQTTEYRPIEPLATVPVTEPGLIPHGALVTGLSSTDVGDFAPAYSIPAVGSDDTTPPAIGEAAFPGTLQRVATLGTFTPTGTSQDAELDLVAGQFFPNPSSTTGTGTQRLFTSISAQVYYDSSGPLATDYTPPTIDQTQAISTASGFSFGVQTTPSSAGDPVDEVVVLYTDATNPGTWHEVTLAPSGTGNWTGTSTSASLKIQYIVEAVDAAGNVAVSDNEGVDFNALTETTTALSSSLNPGSVGPPVTFTATVAADQANNGSPAGNVEFFEDGNPILSCDGQSGAELSGSLATCTVPFTSPGPEQITATYLGNPNFVTSTTATPLVENISQTTTKTAASTSLQASTTSPAVGETDTYTATVSGPNGGATPTGTVSFYDGSNPISCTGGNQTLSGSTNSATATCQVSYNSPTGASPHSITAVYVPGSDPNYFAGAVSNAVPVAVGQAGTSTSLSLSGSSATYGNEKSITFTSTVTPQYAGITPTGTISVMAGSSPLCAILLPAITCTTTSATALAASLTAYSVTAQYGGDNNFTDSTSGGQNLTVNKDTTTAAVSETPTSVAYSNECRVGVHRHRHDGQPRGASRHGVRDGRRRCLLVPGVGGARR